MRYSPAKTCSLPSVCVLNSVWNPCIGVLALRSERLGYLYTNSCQSLTVGCCCFWVVFIPWHGWLSSAMIKAPRQRDAETGSWKSAGARWRREAGGWSRAPKASATAPFPLRKRGKTAAFHDCWGFCWRLSPALVVMWFSPMKHWKHSALSFLILFRQKNTYSRCKDIYTIRK